VDTAEGEDVEELQPELQLQGSGEREGGFTTAELLANAALAIIALVAIWAALQKLGIHVVDWIQQQLGL
jgi:hypothetical protein